MSKTAKELIKDIDPCVPYDTDDPHFWAEELRKFKAQVKEILELAAGHSDGIWRD